MIETPDTKENNNLFTKEYTELLNRKRKAVRGLKILNEELELVKKELELQTKEFKQQDNNIYKLKFKNNVTKYTSKLRVVNTKYNSLGVTITKEIVELIDLTKGDLMTFKVMPKKDNLVGIDIQFVKQ